MRKGNIVLIALLVISPLLYYSTLLLYTGFLLFRFLASGQSLVMSVILWLLSAQTGTDVGCGNCCAGGSAGGTCDPFGMSGSGSSGCYICGTGGEVGGGCGGLGPGGVGEGTGFCSGQFCGSEECGSSCTTPSIG